MTRPDSPASAEPTALRRAITDETIPNDDTTDSVTDSTGMTREEKRHDQLTTAPEATVTLATSSRCA